MAATTDAPTADNSTLSDIPARPLVQNRPSVASPVPVSVASTVLGEVEFTDGQPRYFTLADGQTATITPHVQAEGNLGLDLQVKDSKAQGVTTEQKMQVVVKPGQEIRLALSSGTQSMELSLKPKLAGQ